MARKWNECRCGEVIPDHRIVTCSSSCAEETVAASRAAALLKNTEEFDEFLSLMKTDLDDLDIDFVIEYRRAGGQFG